MTEPRTLQDLLDIEAIKQLKARYARLLDERDWVGFRALFTADATFESPVTQGARIDLDTFLERISGPARTPGAVHQVYLPEIELGGDGTATGIWAMASIFPPEDLSALWSSALEGRSANAAEYADLVRRLLSSDTLVLQGYGYYRDEYRRTEHGWRIAALSQWHDRRDALPAYALRMRRQ